MKCENCGTDETVYDTPDGKRCFKCGWTWEPTTGLIDERPTKPHDAVCGEILYEEIDPHDKRIPKIVDPHCNDGTTCKFNPSGIKEEAGQWKAVCTTHND